MPNENLTIIIPVLRNEDEEEVDTTKKTLSNGAKIVIASYDKGELGKALNVGTREAQTPFVFPIWPGDMCNRDCLDFLFSLCWDVDVTYPSWVVLDETGKPDIHVSSPTFCDLRIYRKNYIHRSSVMKRDSILEVGGYREDLDCWCHWDLYLRLHKAKKKFKAVREAIVLSYKEPFQTNVFVENQEELGTEISQNDLKERAKATFHYQLSYPTTYYRCTLPGRYLPAYSMDIETFELEFDEYGGDTNMKFPLQVGPAIFQFPGDALRYVIVQEMGFNGIPTLIEIDDNYTVSTPHKHKGWTKNIKDPGSPHSLEGHMKICEKAGGIIVTTPYLASFYKKFNKPIFVCPNQIELGDWPTVQYKKDGKIRIGWFASPSHVDDSYLIKRALEWASKQDGVEVVIMGLEPTWWKFPFTYIPWSNDLSTYQACIGMLDIGLAPLKGDPWSLCRSDLKALDYGARKVAPIVSDNAPYYMWSHEETCLKAKTPKEFLDHTKRLVQNERDRVALSDAAHEYVIKERNMEKNVWRWEEAINGVKPILGDPHSISVFKRGDWKELTDHAIQES